MDTCQSRSLRVASRSFFQRQWSCTGMGWGQGRALQRPAGCGYGYLGGPDCGGLGEWRGMVRQDCASREWGQGYGPGRRLQVDGAEPAASPWNIGLHTKAQVGECLFLTRPPPAWHRFLGRVIIHHVFIKHLSRPAGCPTQLAF